MTNGRFGIHGGQYMPETLMNAVIELEEAYNHYKDDPGFNRELTELLNNYAGRPSRLYYAKRMTKDLGGAKIYLKREDLNHTGAHKINNVLGQVLLMVEQKKAIIKVQVLLSAGQKKRFQKNSINRYGYGMIIHGGANMKKMIHFVTYGSSGLKTQQKLLRSEIHQTQEAFSLLLPSVFLKN